MYKPSHIKELEQMDCDLADDELNRIERLKEDLLTFIDKTLCFDFENSLKGRSLSSWVNGQEEDFDALFETRWRRLTQVSGSVEWSSSIPSFADLRKKMNRKIITNPATPGFKG